MKRFIAISLLLYFAFGALMLPKGDFSALLDLTEMYRHCKATEDKDMTPLDFITDHLVNFDGIFDQHGHGDQQKPHSPIQIHHPVLQVVYINKLNILEIKNIPVYNIGHSISQFSPSICEYISLVFRPPIC